MKHAKTVLGAALIAGAGFAALLSGSTLATTPARAAAPKDSATCLQNDLIYNFNVVNTRKVQVTDRNNHLFTVNLTGGCVGLTNLATISFRTTTSLGCLQKGDRLNFTEPTLGRLTCMVSSVEPSIMPKSSS